MIHGWEDIRAEVLRRIRARDWPPGEIIPTEEALAQEFGCARATVNRALRELAQTGVVERRRKAGTRVAMLPIRRATLEIPVIRQEVEARGQTYSFRLLAHKLTPPPVPVGSRMAVALDASLLYTETLHLADAQPFAFEARWLNPAVLPEPAPQFATISINEWLVKNIAYTTGNIAFSAEPANPREAEVMGVAEGTALFITERSTWQPDQAITYVRLTHAPGYRMQTAV